MTLCLIIYKFFFEPDSWHWPKSCGKQFTLFFFLLKVMDDVLFILLDSLGKRKKFSSFFSFLFCLFNLRFHVN